MVREIIHVSVGKCGNKIGNEFWQMLCTEHNIPLNDECKVTPTDSNKLHVYFNEEKNNKQYRARSCIVDLEPETIDNIKASNIASLYNPNNMLCGSKSDTYNPYYAWPTARGDGHDLQNEMLNIIRKEIESCECIQGFQMTHSFAGCTGGGVGSAILMKLRDAFPDKILSSFSVFPGNMGTTYKMSEIDAYFASLTTYELLNNCDITFMFDNSALYNICCNTLKLKEPSYTDMNWLIATAMSSITAPFRCKTSNSLNNNMRKMAINLIPFPNLHFLSTSLSPIYARGEAQKYNTQNVSDIESSLWNSTCTQNWLSNIDANDGRFLTTSLYFRGRPCSQLNNDTIKQFSRIIHPRIVIDGILRNMKINQTIPESVLDVCCSFTPYNCAQYVDKWTQSMYQFEFDINNSKKKMMEYFISWIPETNVTSTLIEKCLFTNDINNCVESSGIMIANTTANKTIFERIYNLYSTLLQREGGCIRAGGLMDKQEHISCGIRVRDLVTEYQDKQDAVTHGYDDCWSDDENEEEEEDEDEDDDEDEDEDESDDEDF
eukprot:206974_1